MLKSKNFFHDQSGGGNAEIEAQLTLPQPCIAPLIFVTSPGGAWFAATGY
jgi:hypothetical protein